MKNLLLILVIAFGLSLKAQPPVRFLTTFGGNGDDVAYSGKITLDRQYIVAGSTSSYGNGNTDVYLVKVDSMGSPVWVKFFGGFGNEVGNSVIQLSDSGFVVAGFTNSFGAGGYDAYVIRTDKNGILIWQKTFGGLDWDFANDVVLGSDGNLFVVGHTNSFGSGNKDGFLIKFDLSGTLLLQKFYGGAENEELRSVIATNDNFIATVGYTESRGEINGDGYFLKLDLNGDTLFTRTFGGPYKDYACDLVQKGAAENDAYFLSGAKTFTSGGKTHSYMYKISSTGSFLLDADYFRNAGDEAFISVTNTYLNTYLTGFARSAVITGLKMQEEAFITYYNGFYYKINAAGSSSDEFVYSMEGTKDGGYLSVGSTSSYGSIGKDVFFVKRDSTVITYSSVVGLEEREKKDNLVILRNGDFITILFTDTKEKKIQVVDVNGRILANYETSGTGLGINFSDYRGGMYILRIEYSDGGLQHYKFLKSE